VAAAAVGLGAAGLGAAVAASGAVATVEAIVAVDMEEWATAVERA